MKLLNWILAGAAALSLSACSSEDAPNPGPGSETTTEGIYSSIYFRMPEARSEASEGEEEGKDSENRVGSIVVILANTENKFVTYAMSDNPRIENGVHTIVFEDKEVLYNEAGHVLNVYAYCNVSETFRAKIAALTTGDDFLDIAFDEADPSSIWAKNGFLMASIGKVTTSLPDKGTLETYNSPSHAFPLGNVDVVRLATRYDFRDAAPDPDKALTYPVYNEQQLPDGVTIDGRDIPVKGADGTVTLQPSTKATDDQLAEIHQADVQFTRVALFNLNKNFYYLPRTVDFTPATPEVEGQAPTENGTYGTTVNYVPGYPLFDTEGFVVTPDTKSYLLPLPATIDPLNPEASGLTFDSLAGILGGEEDNDNDWNNGNKPEWQKFHIWRYGTENTWKQGLQTNANTTGFVFEAKIVADAKAADDKTPMYIFNNVLYVNAQAIYAALLEQPASTLATAFKACFDVTGIGADATVAEKADADFEANGFQRYVANAAGDFLCYYFYFNKHNEDNMPQYVSNMEFANVRNNIYKLYIEKVGRIGTFKPTDVDDWDTYFTISVTVKDWLVRVNGIKF